MIFACARNSGTRYCSAAEKVPCGYEPPSTRSPLGPTSNEFKVAPLALQYRFIPLELYTRYSDHSSSTYVKFEVHAARK